MSPRDLDPLDFYSMSRPRIHVRNSPLRLKAKSPLKSGRALRGRFLALRGRFLALYLFITFFLYSFFPFSPEEGDHCGLFEWLFSRWTIEWAKRSERFDRVRGETLPTGVANPAKGEPAIFRQRRAGYFPG